MKKRIIALLLLSTCLLCSCVQATPEPKYGDSPEKIAERLSLDNDYERHLEKVNITGITGEIAAAKIYNSQFWFVSGQVLYCANSDGSNARKIFDSLPENARHVAFGTNQEIYVGADNAIFTYDVDGGLLSRSSFDYGQIMLDLISIPDESPAALLWNGSENIICSIEAKNLGKEIDFDIPKSVIIHGISVYNASPILSLEDGLHLYSMEETLPLLSWMDIGVADSNSICLVGVSENNGMTFLNRADGCIYTLSDPVLIEKNILNFATIVSLAGTDLEKSIISFNNSNREYKIIVTTYDSLEQLNIDIIAGNIPDLINISDIMPFDSYVAKGLLEDLNPYFDADNEVKLLPQIRKAMLRDGKLYFASPGIYAMTLIGIPEFVGSEYGWTFDEMKDCLDKASEDATVLPNYWTKENLLQYLLYQNMEWTVDWKTGRALFDSPDFKELLAYINTAPDTVDEIPDDVEQIMNGKQLAIHHTFLDIINFAYIDNMFEGNAVFKGFPGSDKSSGVLYTKYKLAMTSVCAEKDAAWSFICQALLDDPLFQLIPAIESKFNDALSAAMTEGDEELGVPPLTNLQHEKLLALLDGLGSTAQVNLDLQNIIEGEVPAYFEGQKSVDEVCAIIQSRAQTYVDERS